MVVTDGQEQVTRQSPVYSVRQWYCYKEIVGAIENCLLIEDDHDCLPLKMKQNNGPLP